MIDFREEMILVVLQILFIIAFALSLTLSVKRAKTYKERHGSYGSYKQYLSSICFFLLAIFNFIVLSLDWLGIVSWVITLLFIVFAGYFTQYIPSEEKTSYQ